MPPQEPMFGIPRAIAPFHLAYAACFAVFAVAFVLTSNSAATILTAIPVFAFAIAAFARQVPFFSRVGLDSIATLCVPSFVAASGALGATTLAHAKAIFDASDVIGVFIVVLIVGSLFGTPRHTLLRGAGRMTLPVVAASLVALVLAIAVGAALGINVQDASFDIAVPVLGGGISAGALPLSIGYAAAFGTPPGEVLASIVPAIVVGNLLAMLAGGILRAVASKGTSVTASRRASTSLAAVSSMSKRPATWRPFVEAIVFCAVIYAASRLAAITLGIPFPLSVLVLTLLNLSTPWLTHERRTAMLAIYARAVAFLTLPILFAVGLFLMPWPQLVAGFAPTRLMTIAFVVGGLLVTGRVTSRIVSLGPDEGALIALSRAAMGGTGCVAILAAANRLDLMPYAQIATRVGGIATVSGALAWAMHLGH